MNFSCPGFRVGALRVRARNPGFHRVATLLGGELGRHLTTEAVRRVLAAASRKEGSELTPGRVG